MEKRRLQATGGSSLTLTLPKDWLDKWQLQSKDEVVISADGPTLLIKPSSYSPEQTDIYISLDGKQLEWIVRETIAAYVSGADKIVFAGKRISPKQNDVIRKTLQQLFGFEILEETSRKIVAQNIADSSRFPLADNTKRIFAIIRSMLLDALRAARAGDKDLAFDVILRDHEVNKLTFAIRRQFTQAINNRVEGNIRDVRYYSEVTTQLERIGDRAVLIGMMVNNEKMKPVELSTSFPEIRGAITSLLDDIEQLLSNPNIVKAQQILDRNDMLEPLMYSSKRMKTTYEGAVIEDNFDRSRGRLMNVAELTIDYLMQQR